MEKKTAVSAYLIKISKREGKEERKKSLSQAFGRTGLSSMGV